MSAYEYLTRGAALIEQVRPVQPAENRTSSMSPAVVVSVAAREATRVLRFDRTVPRELVHRQSVAEVFVTDSLVLGEDLVAVAAQIPRGHVMNRFGDTAREVLILEVLRQASIYAAHECLGVPREMIFVFSDLRFSCVDRRPLVFNGCSLPTVAYLRWTRTMNPQGRITRLEFEGTLLVDDQLAIQATGTAPLVSQNGWKAIRTRGRRALRDAALSIHSGTPANPSSPIDHELLHGFEWVDALTARAAIFPALGHSFYYDHPLDHVPAALLMEAAHQAAELAVARVASSDEGWSISLVEIDFIQFAENDLPLEVALQAHPLRNEEGRICEVRVDAVFTQVGTEVTRVRAELRSRRA